MNYSDIRGLLREVTFAGCRVRRFGGRLAVQPAGRCPDALLARLREAKPWLLDLLRDESDSPDAPPIALAADETPWLPVAEAVLRGAYAAALKSEVQSVLIGVRSIRHPTCQAAKTELVRLLPKARREPPRKGRV